MTPSIITIKNVKTKQVARAYREVYNSAMKAVSSPELPDAESKVDVSDKMWCHIKHMSEIINACIRERLDITIMPKS